MEAQQYIKDYVRDRRTWHRAARQPDDEARVVVSGNINALWDVCRFGTSENVETAKFARALREHNGNIPVPSRKPWVASIQSASKLNCRSSPDVLEAALQRNLRRVGLTIACNAAEEKQQCSLQHRRGGATQSQPSCDRARWVRCALEDLIVDEMTARSKLVKAEACGHNRLRKCAILSAMNALLDDEYNGRRAIFRAAVLEQRVLLEMEQKTFESLSGMSHEQLLELCNLASLENRRRQVLFRLEVRDRNTLSQLLQLLQLESLEREIAGCALREAHLRGVLNQQPNAR